MMGEPKSLMDAIEGVAPMPASLPIESRPSHRPCDCGRSAVATRVSMGKVYTLDRCHACEDEDSTRRQSARFETIPEDFRWAKLDEPLLGERAGARAVERARVELTNGAATKHAFLQGPSGAGKTSLVSAMLRSALERDVRLRALFVIAWDLGTARQRHKLGDGDPPELARAKQVPLLVLDNVGTEPGANPNPVAEVIFARHARRQPTWVTTNLKMDTLKKRYGDEIARRMAEMGRVSVITWKST